MADYVLGVDLGTTFSAAAVHRGTHPEPVTLGASSYTVPSVVYFAEDGSLFVGEEASEAARADPARAVAEFKRRVGDETPIVCGSVSEPASWYMGTLLGWIVERVAAREGGRPSRITLTHPANWGPYKRGLLGDIVTTAGLPEASTITEPAAAAIRYANLGRVELGEAVAIYDFGGGTFDAAVLRVSADGFEILGEPAGIERLGGVDIDWVVYALVNDALDGRLDRFDRTDPALAADLAGLAETCTRAKIALSAHPKTQVRARVGDELIDVVIHRNDFNRSIRAKIDQTIAALEQTVRSAGLSAADLGRILLVGGSSQIPLVGTSVREAFGVDVTVDVDPTNAVATGAALHAHHERTGVPWTPTRPPEPAPEAHEDAPQPSDVVPLRIRWPDGEIVATGDGPLTVGRDPDRDIVLDADVVSRNHGEFRHEGSAWVYEDRRSSNHSFVDGAVVDRIEIEGPLRIGLGRTGPVLEVEPDPSLPGPHDDESTG